MPLFRGWCSWLAVMLVLVATLAGAARGEPAAPHRPNIVLILTDDLDTTDLQRFPNIYNLLVRQGASFSHFFVTNPWCCPSRSSLLRSQYVHSHQVESNRSPTGGFPKFRSMESSTVGTWMHDAGYRTALFGKYLNQYPSGAPRSYIPPGWDEWAVPVTRLYQEYGYALNENGTVFQYGDAPGDYLEDVLSGKADRFVAENDPFFLYLAPVAPHLPAHHAPRHDAAFSGEPAPRTPSFDQEDMSAEPLWLRDRPHLSARDVKRIDRVHQNRMRAMLGVDDMVGALVSSLARAGRLDDTYIFFTSDNGFHLGQHRLLPGKTTPFEEDIRVPMVVRGPGIAPGSTIDRLASTVDLSPTFAELGGAATPDFTEGRSLVPLLQGREVPWRDALLVEFVHAAYSPDCPPTYNALRTDRYSYVEYETGERQLYDLYADPGELRNIAATADPVLVGTLSARLAVLHECSGGSCRIADAAQLWLRARMARGPPGGAPKQ
ncbi:sulfatase [Planotetraspora sp. A-T 1434]|uniref:sulfatase family protein n=1 Tax=Planotetraspora sp. A-T 1434 TaxID=2979219 RepID=UPI0021C06B39|nr:sulfatase [Planotetraspora sp. A-T 1434]MCT9933375.1 sulfatase [Planotetraspora sp. A-T 1434]